MIVKIGNIFESNAKTLVNTVNCVGVMGKGIALDFKNKYPQMYKEYSDLCERKLVKPGLPYYYSDLFGNSIINFPTKDHWRSPSKLSYIISGLDWFRDNYESLNIDSIAFPPLGCGNGGLTWDVVGPVMYEKLNDLPIDIEIYAPYGTKSSQLTESFLSKNVVKRKGDISGKKIEFNPYWYLILYVVQQLNGNKYALPVGRTIFQKICYVVTRQGLDTGLDFVEGSYGPFSRDVKNTITALSNANLITEKASGPMVETLVSSNFVFDSSKYTEAELKIANDTINLFSRIKNTDHAEMVATILYSFDGLHRVKNAVTEKEVYDYVIKWKPHWEINKSEKVKLCIQNLANLNLINTDRMNGLIEDADYLF